MRRNVQEVVKFVQSFFVMVLVGMARDGRKYAKQRKGEERREEESLSVV
jgi:hypothetical protein